MSPPGPSPPVAIVPPRLHRQLQRIRAPQTGNLHRLREIATNGYLDLLCALGVLAVLYVSWVLSSVLGSEDQCSSAAHPSIWVPIAFIVSLAIIAVDPYYFVAQLLNRSRMELSSTRTDDLDPAEEAARAPEILATSPQSLAPGEAVPGTLRPPDLQQHPQSALLQGSHISQLRQPTNVALPTIGRSRHVVGPVERVPQQRAWAPIALAALPATE